jgi:deoxyhypusine monooxygenase
VSRHEAIEALGALGHTETVLPALERMEAQALAALGLAGTGAVKPAADATSAVAAKMYADAEVGLWAQEADKKGGSLAEAEGIAVDAAAAQSASQWTIPVLESIMLAVARLRNLTAQGEKEFGKHGVADFVSVDPAPSSGIRDLARLRRHLLAPHLDVVAAQEEAASSDAPETVGASVSQRLFDRYRAMFALRNLQTPASVKVLCDALRQDRTSCLFRHEIAFVLGQLEHPESIAALADCVRDDAEHAMVRHEAAEALGAIAEPECLSVLREYSAHPDALIRDSCVVALQMHEYWSQFKPAAESE